QLPRDRMDQQLLLAVRSRGGSGQREVFQAREGCDGPTPTSWKNHQHSLRRADQMDLLRVVAPSGTSGTHGSLHERSGLRAVARLLRNRQDFLRRVSPGSGTPYAGCDDEHKREQLQPVDEGLIAGAASENPGVLPAAIRAATAINGSSPLRNRR